jgi:O-antigen ligase
MYQRGGLVGAVLMLAPLIYCLREMVRQRAHPEIRVLLSISVFTLVMAGFNVVLENLYFGLWCWLPLIAATAVVIQRRVGSGGHERR